MVLHSLYFRHGVPIVRVPASSRDSTNICGGDKFFHKAPSSTPTTTLFLYCHYCLALGKAGMVLPLGWVRSRCAQAGIPLSCHFLEFWGQRYSHPDAVGEGTGFRLIISLRVPNISVKYIVYIQLPP